MLTALSHPISRGYASREDYPSPSYWRRNTCVSPIRTVAVLDRCNGPVWARTFITEGHSSGASTTGLGPHKSAARCEALNRTELPASLAYAGSSEEIQALLIPAAVLIIWTGILSYVFPSSLFAKRYRNKLALQSFYFTYVYSEAWRSLRKRFWQGEGGVGRRADEPGSVEMVNNSFEIFSSSVGWDKKSFLSFAVVLPMTVV